LSYDESAVLGRYEYAFAGQSQFSGIQVKRDRSDYMVWAGAGLIVLGLMLTFWVPRRRLWARISRTGSALAGQAPGHADYPREMRRLAEKSGAPVDSAERDE
jgi:cytochrome c biogenesis protein ResB